MVRGPHEQRDVSLEESWGINSASWNNSLTWNEIIWCFFVLFLLVILEINFSNFINTRGVSLKGDEPAYIMQAQSYLHFNPIILSTILNDLKTHAFPSWPIDFHISGVEKFSGPHGIVSPFEPGLGILLIPFVAIVGVVNGGTIGMLILSTCGLILIHRRASFAFRLRFPAQLCLGILFLAPTLFAASTQIYPDLLSGILLGCAVIELIIIESSKSISRFSTTILCFAAALLPWLQIKNLPVGIALLSAFLYLTVRTKPWQRETLIVFLVPLASWGLLFAFNLYSFGLLFGYPEPSPKISVYGLEFTLGLFFDRQQGLLAQVPFAILGILALFLASKRLTCSVITTVVSIGFVWLLNGTYISNPYGGDSFAGRFMWTLLPALLAWSALIFSRWQDANRSFVIPIVIISSAWIYQFFLIFRGSIVLYNYTFPFQSSSQIQENYPSWWNVPLQLLPQFDVLGHPWGLPLSGLIMELGLLVAIALVAYQYMKPGRLFRSSIVVITLCCIFTVAKFVAI